MHLTPSTLVPYLLARRYITREEIMDGDLEISAHTTRNQGFRVLLLGDRGYWVKQLREWNRAGLRAFRREARWYWLVRNEPAFASFRTAIPHCLAYDPTSEILIFELAGRGAADLRTNPARFQPAVASLLGRTLAAVHAVQRSDAAKAFNARSAPPWVLSLHQSPPDPERTIETGQLTVISILNEYPAFVPFLESLAREWNPATLNHGDMKFDNCIASGPAENISLQFIDWEQADWGDPCWDVAGIVQAYWADWIVKRASIETVRAAIRHFWTAWRAAFITEDNDDFLIRSMRFSAARLIQRAWEDRRVTTHASEPVLKMLQLALNIASDPMAAARELADLP